MKFKVDENLPVEIAELLRAVQHEARMVTEQGLSGGDDLHVVDVCRQEERILVTLDLDFADVRAYPPKNFPGFMVIRVHWQDKHHIIETFRRAIPLMDREPVKHRLWIIEETRVRIRD